MTDYLQQMRVRPPLQPAYGYEKEFGEDGILYQLENRNDTQKYKLTTQNNTQKPPPYKHYTKMSNSTNDMFFPRKDPSIPPQCSKSKTQAIRPQSTGKMNKVTGLSISLQLDQDRFVERRRSFDQREYIARQKQEEYENYLRQRSLRASMKEGKEFLELSKRNYEWLQQKEEKRLKQQLQHDEQEQAEILQYRKKLLEHVNKPIPITDHRSWKDIEFEANQKRLENISRRKEELRQRSQSPFPMKRSNFDYGSSSGGGSNQRRKSESNLQLNLSSLLSGRDRPTSSNNLDYTTSNNSIVNSNNNNKPSKSLTSKEFVHFMEKRQNEYIQRKFQREEKLLQKEREEKEKSLRFEKMKYEKILRAPLPIGCERLTRAAEERERMVKARLDKEKHEEEMRAKKAEQQRIKQKEIAAVLRTVISLNDNDRKSRHGGYIELSSSTGATQSAQERAKHGKESYQASLRANQKRIEDVLENRPTLLRRFEEDLARQAAAKRALVKIAYITDSVATDAAAAIQAARKQKNAMRSSNKNKSKEHKHSSSRANGHNHDGDDDDGDDEYENSKSRRNANIPRSESKDSQQDDDCDDRRSNNDDDDHKSVNDNNNNTNNVNDNYDDDNFEDTLIAATKSTITDSVIAESK